jgi:RND family efflux transporter MFP subunit
VFINVPQSYVASVMPGQDVEVTLPEYPGQTFHGKVTRTADALDAAARTERVEIQLPSENGKLLPGMYLAVRFKVQQAVDALILPSNTLDIRKEGPRVATVGADQKILYKKVSLGRDFGKTTEILDGLTGNENIIVNPTPELVDGERVEIAREDKKEPGEAASASQEKK